MWLSNCPSTLAEETAFFFFILYIFASFVKGELTIDTWIYKESACNVGYLGLIPGLGRSSGEGNGYPLQYSWGFPGGSDSEEFACNLGDPGLIPGLERSASHSSILAWRIPWTEKPGGLQSMGLQRVGHN